VGVTVLFLRGFFILAPCLGVGRVTLFTGSLFKTKLHGGRLLATYTPQVITAGLTDTPFPTVAGPEVSPTLQPYSQSKLMDLRDENVFEFRVPYVSPIVNNNFTDAIGAIAINIMDPLQISSVISTTINFIVEVYAAPDFELSIPRGPLYPAHVVGVPKFQSGETSIRPSMNASTSKYTIGEKINSLKQLIMIPELSEAAITAAVVYRALVYPWYYQPPIATGTPVSGYQVPYQAFSFAGNIAKCFAFVRGSTDLHVYVPNPSYIITASSTFGDYGLTNATAAPGMGTALNYPSSALPSLQQVDSCTAHLRYPAYQKVTRIPSNTYDVNSWAFNGAQLVVPSSAGTKVTLLPAIGSLGINNITSNSFARFNRNAGDDAACSMYQGPVPLFIPLVNNMAGSYDRGYKHD